MDLKNSTSWSPISWKPISFSLWEDVTSTTSFNLADADRLATLSSNSHLWFKASFNRVDGNTYDSGAAGYSGDRKLLALGFEKALVPSFNFGLGFAFGKSDLDIFPSPYIHVGGDEAGKASWPDCPRCQQKMKEEGIADVNGLQTHLIRHMGHFLQAMILKHKRPY